MTNICVNITCYGVFYTVSYMTRYNVEVVYINNSLLIESMLRQSSVYPLPDCQLRDYEMILTVCLQSA